MATETLLTFGERVRYARRIRGLTQQSLSNLTGGECTQGIINAIENRKAEKSKYAREIALALNVRLDWLLYGQGEMQITDADIGSIEQQTHFDDYTYNKNVVRIRHHNPHIRRELMLDRTKLDTLGINPQNVRMGQMSGNSMSPIINDGAELAFDTTRTDIKDGKIYALQSGDMLYCTYLQIRPMPDGNQIRLFYANPDSYPDQIMAQEEFFNTYKVLGHIFWWSNTQSW